MRWFTALALGSCIGSTGLVDVRPVRADPSTPSTFYTLQDLACNACGSASDLTVQQPGSAEPEDDGILRIIVTEEVPVQSTPVYVIDAEQIQQSGADSMSEILRGLPGFAINDVGFGADIHTGTSYRGHSINQSVFLIDGRPFNTNISTYHGGTDLNSIPTDAIERVELSSGTAATLYGSEAFGGVVNIVTRPGTGIPRFTGAAQLGSYELSNYRGRFGGSFNAVDFSLGYERARAENNYSVPVGAANRGPDGRLFNGDTAVDNIYGRLGFAIDDRNQLDFSASHISSRKGLLYFGFPLQRDRLNHDGLNLGLTWEADLGASDDSQLAVSVGYNSDYFNTFGPTQGVFFRTGVLDTKTLLSRVQHDWQLSDRLLLQWGGDLRQTWFNGEANSTAPNLAPLNDLENRSRFEGAVFALGTLRLTDTLQTEVGLRQNLTSEFGAYTNPSLGINWAATPGVNLRSSWVSVQRNPGLDQLYLFDTVHNWLSNPDLVPEQGSAWTVGVDTQLAPNLSGQVTYFGSQLNNRLGIRAGRWENIGLVSTNGLELALNWQVSPQWNTFLNYTYTSAQIKNGPEAGLQLSMIPFSVGQVGVGYSHNGWQAAVLASYNSGSRRAFFVNPGDTTLDFTESWLNLDFTARVPVIQNLGLVVYVENLANRQFEKANRIYQPGTTFRIGVESIF